MLPVQLMLNISNHSFFTKAANAAGVSINSYIHDLLIQNVECSQ
jgi:predicted HicB family RNase H-like nuclease